ncbi:MAG: sulfatase-like hydrolase/transferase [Planctomycetaceae bacterium]
MTESIRSRLLGLLSPLMLMALATSPVMGADTNEKVQSPNATKPNIVFIISDDQAWTDYGFQGHPQIETPHLDQLAGRSALFSRGYVPTALCRPALATLMNGMYAHQSRITGNDPSIPETKNEPGARKGESAEYAALREKLISQTDRYPTLPKLLATQGYVSHQSGKWWEGNFSRGGFTAGMTRGFPQPGGRHGDDGLKIGREGMKPVFDFIDQAVADKKPFFTWYAPFLPHSPHNPPKRLFDKYKAKGVESDHVARYYAMVEWFDETVGELTDHLEEKGVINNTLIVYIGDNGWIQSPDSPNFAPRSKQSANEGGVRQPTLFSWPGVIKPGSRGNQLCSSIDIVPTALAAAGIDVPAEMPGINLIPILKSGEPTPRKIVLGEGFAHDVADIENPEASLLYRWVIKDQWKLLLTYDGKVGRYGKAHPQTEKRPQLFDLLKDPHEDHNVAGEHPELVAELAKTIEEWWPVKTRKVQTTFKAAAARRPNVLFLAIDDQNDWVGHLGGHPLAKTPNIDAIAARGTTFLNAHCQAPLCNPSRTSLMLSLRPSTTGVYGLAPWFRTLDDWKDRVALPQHFATHGYKTAATGKIYHGGTGGGGRKKPAGEGEKKPTPEFQLTAPYGGVGTKPPKKLIPATPMGNHPLMDWGVWPLDNDDTQKGDYLVASWTCEQIKTASPDEPFFLAAGFFLPHVPCYATQQWFDLYPDDDTVLPQILEGDREDTPRFSWYLHWKLPEPRLAWVRENQQWRNLVRSYLASTSFVDAQIGRIMQALEESGQADNTIIVIWGDHGWHLGEKGITGKNTLWDDGTRVPLIFAGPGVTPQQRCSQPAELLDIYPTLIDLCSLAPRQDLEGISLLPQLQNAATTRDRPAITSHNQGNHGVRSERWRYIRYADGSEELYDHTNDANEWHNLASHPDMADVLAEHRRWLPKVDVPPAAGSAHRVLTYDRKSDEAIWEGTLVRRNDPIPQ